MAEREATIIYSPSHARHFQNENEKARMLERWSQATGLQARMTLTDQSRAVISFEQKQPDVKK